MNQQPGVTIDGVAGNVLGGAAKIQPLPIKNLPGPPTEATVSSRHSDGADQQGHETLTRRIELLSAIIELVARVNSIGHLEEAGTTAAETIRDWVGAAGVDLFWQRKSQSASVIVGHSGTHAVEVGQHDELLLAAAEEVLTRSTVADSGAKSKREQVALLAVRGYAQASATRRIIGAPLGPPMKNEPDEICRGAVLLRFDRLLSENEADEIRSRLDAAREPLFAAMSKIATTEPSKWTRWLYKDAASGRRAKRRMIAFLITVLLGVLLIPMPYHVPVKSELQPVGRRYVAAPVSGPLEKVLVRPGDQVRAGDLLARLDARELEMELAGKHAELVRLQQEQKGQLAQHKFAESKLAQLRADRLQSEIGVLELRRGRLEVLAPIDGVIVTGDWQRSEGTLLDRGETMFEIAPLGDYIVEVAVEEADVRLLRPGMPIRFRLDAMPNQKFSSTIDRIHPRSELHDGDNVFLAEASLVDTDGLVRPGMRGSGHVETDAHSIGWNLFHRAYYRLLFLIGV